MRHVLPLCAILLAAPFGGCAGDAGVGAHAGEVYAVSVPRTPFYKFGPAQANGADSVLLKGGRIKMLSRQYGYSNIALEDGETGYVATDDLAPAPALPRPAMASPSPGGSRKRSRRPTFEEESSLPPPELPKAQPEPPTFRY